MVTGADSELPVEGSGEEGEFGFAQAMQLASFFLHAPKRHPALASVTAIVIVVLGVAAAAFWPRSYDCDVRILAQHNLVLPALDNPTRAVPRDADAPTKNATDAILQHDNLVTMIKELDLITRWRATRPAALRFKDSVLSFGASANRSEEEQMRDMIELVQRRLSVMTDESSITIAISWPDRQIGFEIVSFLQKNFLEARYDSNVNVIVEAIHILDERAKPQAAEVDATLADVTKIEDERRQSLVGTTSTAATRPRGGRAARTFGVGGASSTTQAGGADSNADLARQLEDVRSRIRSITQERDRQLMEAHQQLADARATLGPLHPTVVALNEKIAQLEAPPPELHALEEQEHQLVAALAAPTPSPAAPAAPTGAPVVLAPPLTGSATPVSPSAPTMAELLREDPQVAVARARLQAATAKYNDLLSRIEAANIELEVTRAAFKYQYTVVRPPELARKPSKPNVMLILLATLLGAPLLGIVASGIRDLLRGRFVEPWQVERHLNLPLLGELNPPP